MLYLEDYLESECAAPAGLGRGGGGRAQREWPGGRDGGREGEAGAVSPSR